MTYPPEVDYAYRAFGDNPAAVAFYLREFGRPGEFDDLVTRLMARAQRREHPAKRRILAKKLRQLRERRMALEDRPPCAWR